LQRQRNHLFSDAAPFFGADHSDQLISIVVGDLKAVDRD